MAIVVLFATAAVAADSAFQQPEGTLAGRVVDAASGGPIEGALVTVASAGGNRTVTTGSSGQFAVVRPGGFASARISVTKPGYIRGYVGQSDASDYVGAGSLDVAPGERRGDLVIRLWAEAVITGQVVDHISAPIVGAPVEILKRVYAGNALRWQRARAGVKPTDERGMYRVEGLVPGDYLLMVRSPAPKGSDLRVIPPTYFPGSNRIASGSAITVASGEVRTVDVTVDEARLAGRVTGQLVGADRSMAGAVVLLAPLDMNGGTNEFDQTVSIADSAGRFQFPNVPEGDYRLTVCDFPKSESPVFWANGDSSRLVIGFHSPRMEPWPVTIAQLPDAPTWVADLPIAVESQKTLNLAVPLSPGAHISGRVVFDGAKPKPTAEDLLLTPVVVRSVDGSGLGVASGAAMIFPQPRIESDGRFRSVGLRPGDYVLNVYPWRSTEQSRIRDWLAASITVGGRETIGTGIPVGRSDVSDVVITMVDVLPELIGTVRDAQGAVRLGSRVIVFPVKPEERQLPADPAPSRVTQVLVDGQAVFRTTLVPGDYFAVAVLTLPADWMMPERLRSLEARATKLTVRLGEHPSLTLTAR